MRPLLVAAGVAGIAGGGVLAGSPFRIAIDLSDSEQADATCQIPLLGAWNGEPKGQLALWAVTYADGSTGHEVRFGAGPYCASQARVRLAAATALFAAGVTTAVVGLRAAR